MLVSIITVNYNQPKVTEELLASLRTVNDLGFAGGNNLGYKYASGKLFFFINNDTEVTSSLIGNLVNYLESNPQVGMVSPKILYFDQPTLLQYAGFTEMNYLTARNQAIGQWEVDAGQRDNLTGKTGFIHGAAMMVTSEAILATGLMADNYFLYYEEIDWCDRIRRNGFEIHVNMQATIYHKESISVGKNSALKEYFMNRNRILFIRKNTSTLNYVIFCLYFLGFVTPRNLFKYLKNREYKFIPVLFRAITWHLYNSTSSKHLGFLQR